MCVWGGRLVLTQIAFTFHLFMNINLMYLAMSKRMSSKADSSTSSHPSSSKTRITGTNGIIAPPQTYSRQLHHRTAARQRQSLIGSRSKGASTTTSGKQSDGSSMAAKGAKQKAEKRESEIRLCPLRHKVSEVCDICMARYILLYPRSVLCIHSRVILYDYTIYM